MIKIVKYICHKIYSIGKFEELRLNNIEWKKHLAKNAVIGDEVFISSQSVITNNRNDSDKIKIGEGSRIMGDLFTFHHGGEISIGDNCFLGPQSRIWSAQKIKIGNRVLIAHNVNIHDNNSHPIDWNLRHKEYVEFTKTGIHIEVDLNAKEINIEDDVWIGFNVIILKGVTIGRGAIIGAGSVVLQDVEPWTINVGNPLRCIEKLQPGN